MRILHLVAACDAVGHSSTPTLTNVSSFHFTYHAYFGHIHYMMGIVNTDGQKHTLVKSKWANKQFIKITEKEIPLGMPSHCKAYSLADGKIILKEDCETRLFDGDLALIERFRRHDDYGWMIGVLYPDWLVYSKRTVDKSGYAVDIYR